jgi:nucleotide-binding universal stress UspA family protein
MPHLTDRPVLAGVNGSAESLAALGLAATEAGLRHALLLVIHAWAGPPWLPVRARSAPAARTDAERLLAAATVWLRRHHPRVAVTGRLQLGDPVDVLADGSRTAQLVVVGHGGTGLATLGRESVAEQLSRRSRAPLLVRAFRPAGGVPAADAPVMVAVAAEPSDRTLRFAFAEAARYGVPLVPCYVGRPAGDGGSRRPAGDVAVRPTAMDEVLAEWSARFPGVDVRPQVRPGRDVARTLAGVARRARLLVVGAGPDRALAEVLRGSVSRGVLRAASCPVAVVPEPTLAGHRGR